MKPQPATASLPTSRAAAKAAGEKFYFTGKPCKHGHVAPRSVGSKICVECSRARAKAWGEANPERKAENFREWRVRNLEERTAYQAAWREENRETTRKKGRAAYWENAEKNRTAANTRNEKNKRERPQWHWAGVACGAAKTRAKLYKVPFDLDRAWFLANTPDICPVFGLPLDYTRTTMGDDSPSVDRLHPSGGYVRSNVRVISFLANRAKQNIEDPALFRRLAEWMEAELASQPPRRSGPPPLLP